MRLRKKNHPINLNQDYPCPCRRPGKLSNITLTEAMGCGLCQNIFVLSPEGESIEQLNAHYPYKKVWRWNGKRWISMDKPWQENYFIVAGICFLFSVLIATPLLVTLRAGFNLISVIMVGLIIIFLSLFLWFVYHR